MEYGSYFHNDGRILKGITKRNHKHRLLVYNFHKGRRGSVRGLQPPSVGNLLHLGTFSDRIGNSGNFSDCSLEIFDISGRTFAVLKSSYVHDNYYLQIFIYEILMIRINIKNYSDLSGIGHTEQQKLPKIAHSA